MIKMKRRRKVSKKYIIKKKSLQHTDHIDTLFNNKQMYHKIKTIRGVSHQLGSYEVNKISLSCFDDKIYICCGSILSLV